VVVRDDADRLRDKLRLSNAEHKRLFAAARVCEKLHGARNPPEGVALATLVFEHGAEATVDALMLAHAESVSAPDNPNWLGACDAAGDMADLRLPVSGEDLKQRGLQEGRAIGAALKYLQARWIREGFPRDPAVIARLIDDAVAGGE